MSVQMYVAWHERLFQIGRSQNNNHKHGDLPFRIIVFLFEKICLSDRSNGRWDMDPPIP